MWINRNQIEAIKHTANTRPVLLLTGARQTGKSTLLKKIFPKADYVTMDRPLVAEEAESNPELFLSKFKQTLVIDEIQYTPTIFRYLKIIVDENRSLFGKWILTGSQKFLLMKNVSESLAGRIGVLELDTLSAEELRSAKIIDDTFLFKGGYPELWTQNLNTKEFFNNYLITYLERDLRSMLVVSDLRTFEKFIIACAIRAGSIFNASDIARDIGITASTIKAWLNVLIAGGLVYCLEPYFENMGKRLIKSPKIYFRDHGLLCNLLNINSLDDWQTSPYKGAVWENLVFTELYKKLILQSNEKNIYFWQDKNNVEVDFLILNGNKKILIEAKATQNPSNQKTNLDKVAKMFSEKNIITQKYTACMMTEKNIVNIKDTKLINPMYCSFDF